MDGNTGGRTSWQGSEEARDAGEGGENIEKGSVGRSHRTAIGLKREEDTGPTPSGSVSEMQGQIRSTTTKHKHAPWPIDTGRPTPPSGSRR